MLDAGNANLKGVDGTPPGDEAELLSPSLLPPRKVASYEMKFLVRPGPAEEVRAWARANLAADAYAESDLGDAYHIHSIYLDTDGFDIFHQSPSYKRRKFRIRRYGNESAVYLERKTKSGDRVSKRRTRISSEELWRLRAPVVDAAWPAEWFQRRLLARRLQPRCVIHYERIAYVGLEPTGPVRLTLDRHIHCALVHDFEVCVGRPR